MMNELFSWQIENNWSIKLIVTTETIKATYSDCFSEIFLDTMDGKHWMQKPKAIDNTA